MLDLFYFKAQGIKLDGLGDVVATKPAGRLLVDLF
jgi:hypothetical protein